jgi:hypothetical protein
MIYMKCHAGHTPTASLALLAGLLLCSAGAAMAQCPPGYRQTYAIAPSECGSAYRQSASSAYRSLPPRSPLGGRWRTAIRSRSVSRSVDHGWTPQMSPPVVYANPNTPSWPTTETYSSYSSAMNYQRCVPSYSAPQSYGGGMGWAPSQGTMCYPGSGPGSWSSCQPSYP